MPKIAYATRASGTAYGPNATGTPAMAAYLRAWGIASTATTHPAADRDATGDGRIVGASRSRAPGGGSSRGVPQSHQHEAGRRSIWPSRSICASYLYARPQLWTPHRQAHDDELRRVWLSTSYRATPGGGCRCSPVKGRPDKRSVKTGGERDSPCPRYRPKRGRLRHPQKRGSGLHLPADRMGRSVRMRSGCTRTG